MASLPPDDDGSDLDDVFSALPPVAVKPKRKAKAKAKASTKVATRKPKQEKKKKNEIKKSEGRRCCSRK